MATSQAQVEANRRNALKSCGPKSPGGKDRSRANALQHGLTAKVLRTAEEVEELGEAIPPPAGPPGSSPLDRQWVRDEILLLGFRIKRAGVMEMKLRDRSAIRASSCWDADRRSESEVIGSKLGRTPSEVAARLEVTPHGCHWMIERWAMLARIADRDGAWSPELAAMAFDLLGTPRELRNGPVSEQIDVQGQEVAPGQGLADFARRNVRRLLEIQEKLAEVDEFDRSTAEAGLAADLGPEGRRLARYEAALHRRLLWVHELLERMPEDKATAPEPIAPESAPVVEETDEPPIGRPAAPVEIPPPSRHDRRRDRAERRRLAADRKLAHRLE
jgi:hypothetical protein